MAAPTQRRRPAAPGDAMPVLVGPEFRRQVAAFAAARDVAATDLQRAAGEHAARWLAAFVEVSLEQHDGRRA